VQAKTPSRAIELATQAGAKITMSYGYPLMTIDGKEVILYQVLDMPDTPLWWAFFPTEEYAARAFLCHIGVRIEE
jgi:hypothetical protein